MKDYQDRLESALLQGVLQGLWGEERLVRVSFGRLDRLPPLIGALGKEIETNEILAIDYYGYLKKSRGLWELGQDSPLPIWAPVVFFNGIKLELLAQVGPGLVQTFAEFKQFVLGARGIRNGHPS